jgi:hypothetical protein
MLASSKAFSGFAVDDLRQGCPRSGRAPARRDENATDRAAVVKWPSPCEERERISVFPGCVVSV